MYLFETALRPHRGPKPTLPQSISLRALLATIIACGVFLAVVWQFRTRDSGLPGVPAPSHTWSEKPTTSTAGSAMPGHAPATIPARAVCQSVAAGTAKPIPSTAKDAIPQRPQGDIRFIALPGALTSVPARALRRAIESDSQGPAQTGSVENGLERHGLTPRGPSDSGLVAPAAALVSIPAHALRQTIATEGPRHAPTPPSSSGLVAPASLAPDVLVRAEPPPAPAAPAPLKTASEPQSAGGAVSEKGNAKNEEFRAGQAVIDIENRPITSLTVNIDPKAGERPEDLGRQQLARMQDKPAESVFARDWPMACFQWEAPALAYRPLYFEEVNLERYGYGMKYLRAAQPLISAGQFFTTVPILPYKMFAEPARTPVYTLGHYRPGSDVPFRPVYPPLSISGGAAEAGVAAGLILVIP